MFSVNRIVALLTPVFTAGAALASAYAAKHGLNLSASEVLTVEVAAATAAGGAALKWLHGHQKYEQIVHDAELALKYIESQEKIQGVPAAADTAHWNEHVKNLQDQTNEARAQVKRALAERAEAQQQAGVALTQLAHVRRLIGDPNLILPDAPDAAPQVETQPPVAPAVPDAPEQAVSQGTVAAPVPTINEQTQAN